MDGEKFGKATRTAVVHIILCCVSHLGALWAVTVFHETRHRCNIALLRNLDSSGHVSDKFLFSLKHFEQYVSIYPETVFICSPNICTNDSILFYMWNLCSFLWSCVTVSWQWINTDSQVIKKELPWTVIFLQTAHWAVDFFLNAKLCVVSTFVDLEAVVEQKYISDM